jgi:alpha-beta hydrolase superfamily lysophospholipase
MAPNQRNLIMKFSAIAFITISLILPIKANCRPEAAPNRQRAQIDATCFRMALTYSDGGFKANQPDSAAIRWHKRANSATLKAVALVIHGLNCRPDKMESIIAELTARGIDCLNLSLRGHGENYTPIENKTSADARMEAFKRVSYALWKSETYQAYKHIKKRSNQYQVPLFFVGFSMGGLLGVDLLASNPEVKFDKMVLFAPALKMRTRNHLLKIFSLFPSLVIPSMAHTSYLANSGTPMAAYNALFDMYQHF